MALLWPQQEALRQVRPAGVSDRRQEASLFGFPFCARRLPAALLHRLKSLFPEN